MGTGAERKHMDEVKRIKAAYAHRDSSGKRALYTYFKRESLFTFQQREAAVLDALGH